MSTSTLQSNRRQAVGFLLIVVVVVLLAAGWFLPAYSTPAVLPVSRPKNWMKQIALTAALGAMDRPEQGFRFGETEGSDSRALRFFVEDGIRRFDAHILVTTFPVFRETNSPRVIAVWDRSFPSQHPSWYRRSVPQVYPAALSSGEPRLLTPDEYRALDLTAFVRLDSLYPTPQ